MEKLLRYFLYSVFGFCIFFGLGLLFKRYANVASGFRADSFIFYTGTAADAANIAILKEQKAQLLRHKNDPLQQESGLLQQIDDLLKQKFQLEQQKEHLLAVKADMERKLYAMQRLVRIMNLSSNAWDYLESPAGKIPDDREDIKQAVRDGLDDDWDAWHYDLPEGGIKMMRAVNWHPERWEKLEAQWTYKRLIWEATKLVRAGNPIPADREDMKTAVRQSLTNFAPWVSNTFKYIPEDEAALAKAVNFNWRDYLDKDYPVGYQNK